MCGTSGDPRRVPERIPEVCFDGSVVVSDQRHVAGADASRCTEFDEAVDGCQLGAVLRPACGYSVPSDYSEQFWVLFECLSETSNSSSDSEWQMSRQPSSLSIT